MVAAFPATRDTDRMSFEYVLKKNSAPSGVQINYRAELNDEQYEAVTAKPGPILVIAGAGSGKTRTLTYRVAYLIENGVEPENILLLTFTNKASREMLQRVGNLLPQDISRILGRDVSLGGEPVAQASRETNWGSAATSRSSTGTTRRTWRWRRLKSTGLDPKDKSLPKGAVLLDIFGLAASTEKSIATVVSENYGYFSGIIDHLERIGRIFSERKKIDKRDGL